jgi:CubicO group peptidase (beta-lactamase class C family)
MRSLVSSVIAGLAASAPAVSVQPARDAQIDRVFATWDKGGSPGCTAGVIENGRYTYQKGFGRSNLDYDIPNSPDLQYYVGSVSKQFAAAAVALLSLEGRVDLDADVRKYFPEMRAYQRPITVRHLIHHTSGLRDIYVLMSLGGLRMEDVMPDTMAIGLIARQRELNFAPGDDYLYSNSGYFLLGQLVKRVTGKSLREYADEKMFKPLGMTNTHFHDDPGHVMPKRAMAYEPDASLPLGVRISYLQNFDKIGAGGLYTTLDDLRKWDENYYTKQVGGEALQRLIHTRGVLTKGDTLPYAFGNNVTTYRGLRVTEHGGALMGYRAALMRFPDQRTSVVLLCNLGSIDPSSLANRVADIVLADKLGPAPAPPAAPGGQGPRPTDPGQPLAADDLTTLPGSYYSDEVNATYRVVADGQSLVLQVPNATPARLRKAGPNEFRGAGGWILRFTRQGAENASGLTVDAGRVRNIRFDRR